MKERRNKCVVSYWPPEMIGFNESVEVGKSADLFIDDKQKPHRDATGIYIDYTVDDYDKHYAKVRGLVTNIKAVFVDEYANIEDGTYHYDDPNNKFHIIDIDYADGDNNYSVNSDSRRKFDVRKYIILIAIQQNVKSRIIAFRIQANKHFVCTITQINHNSIIKQLSNILIYRQYVLMVNNDTKK